LQLGAAQSFERAFLIILLLILSFVILKWKRENDGEEYVLEPRRRSNRFSDGSPELDDLIELQNNSRQTQPGVRRSSFKNTSVLSTKSVRFSTTSQTFSYPKDPNPGAYVDLRAPSPVDDFEDLLDEEPKKKSLAKRMSSIL